MASHHPGIYVNPKACSWRSSSDIDPGIVEFHRRMPDFAPTPLVSVKSVAKELGIKHVFIKDESSRAGLPAFKILGASWATYRAVVRATNSAIGVSLEVLAHLARKRDVRLFAATDGNHGRAVARMAGILGVESNIFVPSILDQQTQDCIADEGARVVAVDGDYGYTVRQAKLESQIQNGILIQDTAFDGYTEIAQWIVDGYSTMMVEVDEQVFKAAGSTVDCVVVPVGVGSFAQSAVSYWKSRSYPCTIVTVEPDSAACLKTSLASGKATTVHTGNTIMSGMNCGTVSSLAWPILRDGVDISVSVSDAEADRSVKDLQPLGVQAGPCGAATYAALRLLAQQERDSIGLFNADSTVVLFCTEGKRGYQAPTEA